LKVDFQPVLRLTAAAEAFRTRPMTASSGVFERHGRSFTIGDAVCAAAQKRDPDVSGMAPPSRMMRTQRSRIAANASSVATLIL
jgi:hypothetical protein